MAERKPLVLAASGLGQEFLTGDTLLVPGHLSLVGGGTPTVSTGGTLLAGSNDSRGGITVATNTTSVTLTFATPWASAPWPLFTTGSAGSAPACTARSTTAATIALSSNLSGITVYYDFRE